MADQLPLGLLVVVPAVPYRRERPRGCLTCSSVYDPRTGKTCGCWAVAEQRFKESLKPKKRSK